MDYLEIPFGYRKFGIWTNGTGNQIPVHSKEDVVSLINKHLGTENIGLSICAYIGETPYVLYIPFDFDSDGNKKEALKDAAKLYNHFVELNYNVSLTDSGRKGFHVYVKVVPKSYSRECLKAFQKWFIKKLDLKTADDAILGDIKRQMRIPYTYNIRGGLCKEIASNPGVPIDIDDLLLYTYTQKPITFVKKDFHEYPCIEQLVREDPEPRELIRMSYVSLRLDKGWSEDEIVEEIKSFDWVDFEEEKTRTKIGYVNTGEYVPLGCTRIKEMGHCLPDCKFNNGNLKKDLEELGIE